MTDYQQVWRDREGSPNITSYQEAVAHFNSRPRFIRGTTEKLCSKPRLRNRRMRMEGNDVVFSYQGYDIARWHPDGQVSVKAPDAQCNMYTFERAVMPAGIGHEYSGRFGCLTYLYPEHYPYVWGNQDETYVIRTPDWVRLKKVGNRWQPVDETSCPEFVWHELAPGSRKGQKNTEVAKFATWLRAIEALEADPTEGKRTCSWRGGRETEAIEKILAGDLVGALAHLPLGTGKWTWDAAHQRYVQEGQPLVAQSSINRIRARLHVAQDRTTVSRARMVTFKQLRAIDERVRRFGKVTK